MLTLLTFCVVIFAILLHEVESGRACYVGDKGCTPPDLIAGIVHEGDRIQINKLGNPSQFSNAFYGLWFGFVTLTTTGYGDIVPVTNAGQIMAIILMICGAFYMAMPLTAASVTFYSVHQQYSEKKAAEETTSQEKQKKETRTEEKSNRKISSAKRKEIEDLRLKEEALKMEDIANQASVRNLIKSLSNTTKIMRQFLKAINAPVGSQAARLPDWKLIFGRKKKKKSKSSTKSKRNSSDSEDEKSSDEESGNDSSSRSSQEENRKERKNKRKKSVQRKGDNDDNSNSSSYSEGDEAAASSTMRRRSDYAKNFREENSSPASPLLDFVVNLMAMLDISLAETEHTLKKLAIKHHELHVQQAVATVS
jgi:cobalamin biosynthesis protein CobT